MKTFRLQLRFLVPLVLILTGAAYLALPLMDRLTLRWFARDLDMRGALVANALSDSLTDALQETRGRRLQSLFDRAVQDERLVAIGWCSPGGQASRARGPISASPVHGCTLVDAPWCTCMPTAKCRSSARA